MSPPPACSTLSTPTWRCATRSDYLHRLLGCDHAIDRHHRGDIDAKVIATTSKRHVTTSRAAVAGSIERFGLLNSRPGLGKTRGEHVGCCCGLRPNLSANPVALVERPQTPLLPTHPSRPIVAPLRAAGDAPPPRQTVFACIFTCCACNQESTQQDGEARVCAVPTNRRQREDRRTCL